MKYLFWNRIQEITKVFCHESLELAIRQLSFPYIFNDEGTPLTLHAHQACVYYAFKIAYQLCFEAMLQNFAYYTQIMLYTGVYVSQYAPQIQHYLSLILLKAQNHEYWQSLFIYFPNTVQFSSFFQLVPLQSRTYLVIYTNVATCTNTLISSLLHLQLQCDNNITTDSLKFHNPVQSMCYIAIGYVNYAGNLCLLCWYYAQCFYHLLCS